MGRLFGWGKGGTERDYSWSTESEIQEMPLWWMYSTFIYSWLDLSTTDGVETDTPNSTLFYWHLDKCLDYQGIGDIEEGWNLSLLTNILECNQESERSLCSKRKGILKGSTHTPQLKFGFLFMGLFVERNGEGTYTEYKKMRDRLRYVHFPTNGWGRHTSPYLAFSPDCHDSDPHLSLRLLICAHNQWPLRLLEISNCSWILTFRSSTT